RGQLHAHLLPAFQPFHTAHYQAGITDWHIVGQAHPPTLAVELGAEYQGVLLVMAFYPLWWLLRSYLPEAVFIAAEQLAEAGRGVEARRAEPVDAAIAPDQGGAAQVTEQGIILDGLTHADLRWRG